MKSVRHTCGSGPWRLKAKVKKALCASSIGTHAWCTTTSSPPCTDAEMRGRSGGMSTWQGATQMVTRTYFRWSASASGRRIAA